MKWYSPKRFAALSLLVSLPGFADVAQWRPVVVELFTSQGCSSCPAADALLGELAARPNVIALAFHVDYWDSIGWRDRFEISDAGPRQLCGFGPEADFRSARGDLQRHTGYAAGCARRTRGIDRRSYRSGRL